MARNPRAKTVSTTSGRLSPTTFRGCCQLGSSRRTTPSLAVSRRLWLATGQSTSSSRRVWTDTPMSIDKLAPQAVEAEQSVLGSILIDPDAVLKVADFLRPADFYRQQHADIYEAMLGLHGQREPIDLVTLADELARRDRLEPVGGPGLPRQPDECRAHRGPRRALRPHRRAQGRAAQPDRRRRAGSLRSATRRRTTPRSRSTGRRGSSSRSASTAPPADSSRWRPCSVRPTTGSSTCTSIAASSWVFHPGSRTWTRCSGASSPRT